MDQNEGHCSVCDSKVFVQIIEASFPLTAEFCWLAVAVSMKISFGKKLLFVCHFSLRSNQKHVKLKLLGRKGEKS